MDILMRPDARRSPGNPFFINGQILKSLLSSVCPLRGVKRTRRYEWSARDVQCHLDESGTGALLYANWSTDDPVFARFVLPTQTTEDAFDAEAYVRLCEG